MKYLLNNIPVSERPRERLEIHGSSALADYELIAIILETGSKNNSVLNVARQLTMYFNNLNQLNEATISELMDIKGIGKAKAIKILAVVELGKRINLPIEYGDMITSPKSSYLYLKNELENLNQETFKCLYLNSRNNIIAERVISIGTLDQTIVHPRDILKWALKYSAYGILVAHNHPSGDSHPSQMDIKVTQTLIEATSTMGIAFVDHIIIGKNNYYSFSEKKAVFH
mgnify:CR=1 FL=1